MNRYVTLEFIVVDNGTPIVVKRYFLSYANTVLQ